jgi:hypothetical protein
MKFTDQHSSRIEEIITRALYKHPSMMKQIKHHRRCEGGEECYCDEEEWVADSQGARLCAQHILLELGKLEADIGDK